MNGQERYFIIVNNRNYNHNIKQKNTVIMVVG